MSNIIEIEFIENITKNYSRSSLQLNELHESDAELITIPDSKSILAISTDSIVEEIQKGLYSDPHLIGWMTVMVNLSDLAAVGAKPIGILINQTITNGTDRGFLDELSMGIESACRQYGISVLGGDINFSSSLNMSGCALGTVYRDNPMTRIGSKEGDFLFSSGLLGGGNGYAVFKFYKDKFHLDDFQYLPYARIKEGQLIADYASCCIDSSDGLFSALNQLMILNNVGFDIQRSCEEIMDHQTYQVMGITNFPPLLLLNGPHGEFELIFTVPAEKVRLFKNKCTSIGWEPIWLGKAIKETEIKILLTDKPVRIDTFYLRNLYHQLDGDIEQYVKAIFLYNDLLKGQ